MKQKIFFCFLSEKTPQKRHSLLPLVQNMQATKIFFCLLLFVTFKHSINEIKWNSLYKCLLIQYTLTLCKLKLTFKFILFIICTFKCLFPKVHISKLFFLVAIYWLVQFLWNSSLKCFQSFVLSLQKSRLCLFLQDLHLLSLPTNLHSLFQR